MKTRNYALMIAASVMAAVSCNIINNFDVDVPKLIDDTEKISTAKLFDVGSDHDLSNGSKGDLVLTVKAEKPVSKKIDLTSSDQKIGEINIPVSDAPTTVESAATSDGQIILIIDNPSPEKVNISGTIEASPVTKAASKINFNVVVPPSVSKYKVLLKDSSSSPVENTDGEGTTGLGFKNALGGTKFSSPVKLEVFAKSAGTKADAATKASAELTVDAMFKAPFTIKKGTIIKVTKSFVELGLDLSKYSVKASKYDVKLSVTSTMPFTITGDANSKQGVSASISTPIAAGSPSSPKTTSATVAVIDDSPNHIVNEARIGLVLTAAEDGAKISSDTGLDIYYDSVLFHKL